MAGSGRSSALPALPLGGEDHPVLAPRSARVGLRIPDREMDATDRFFDDSEFAEDEVDRDLTARERRAIP